MRGIETNALAQADGWTLIETVGIPVEQAEWSGIGRHGEPQGLTGMFTEARNAAVPPLEARGAAVWLEPPVGEWSARAAVGSTGFCHVGE